MRTLALALILALPASVADARSPGSGGLSGIALSPDGKTIACGGDNRCLYIVSADKFEVRQRIWTQARIGALEFTKDGSRLILEDDADQLRWFDTATWKEVACVKNTSWMSCAPDVGLLAAIGTGTKAGVRLLSMADGSEKGFIGFAGRINVLALAADGKSLAMLADLKESTEKRLDSKEMPKDLQGMAKKEWTQKNDGRMSEILWFEVPSGKQTGSSKIWYAPWAGAHMFLAGGAAHVIAYDDANVKITAGGEVTMFEVTGSYNYARNSSPDCKAIAGGGLRSGALLLLDGMKASKFEIDSLPGFPEYYGGFAFAADGSCYGVTSASRLVRFAKDGKVELAAPIF